MGPDRSYRLGVILVTASAIAWSTTGLFTRQLTVDAPTMLLWRGVFGALGMMAFLFLRDGRGAAKLLRMDWRGWLISGTGAVAMLFFILSLRLTTVAHVSIIYAVVPFIAGGLAWITIGERMSTSAAAASFAALAGVVIMVGFGWKEGSLAGDFLALLMTLGMAVIMIMARHYRGTPMLPTALFAALLSAIAVAPFASVASLSSTEWIMLAGFGIVNSALGLSLFTIGSKMLPPAETALIGALDAPLAPVWVWLVFSETPGPATITGGLIVFAAVGAHMLISLRGSAAATQAKA